MRLTASVAGLFLCAIIFATNSSQASAEAPYQSVLADEVRIASVNQEISVFDVVRASQASQTNIEKQAEKPVEIEHLVSDGESLSEIAKQHQTTWVRLYAKNLHIQHPDLINPGDKLIIPAPDETLPDRALPETPDVTRQKTVRSRQSAQRPKTAAQHYQPISVSRGASAGNRYTHGYCTWYVKNRRPDLPNNLGNADTWVARARAQGIPTGSVPRAGAVGQRGMHVVYVERVNADGSIFISEMNRAGWNVTSTRTVPASYFSYIY